MKKIIKLFRKNGVWFAQYINDEEITRLFKTDTLETGFPAAVKSEIVLKSVQSNNPNHKVVALTN